MKDRLEQFLTAEGITRANFADSIGVARPAVTHILSGRNNPGYDFIVNTMKAYPTLNIEWLLNGTGSMYKTEDLFTIPQQIQETAVKSPRIVQETTKSSPSSTQISEEGKSSSLLKVAHQVNRIIVFYNDGTFEELSRP